MKCGNVSMLNTRNAVFKNVLLTFSARGGLLPLQGKINAIRSFLVAIVVVSMFASCNKDIIHGDGSIVTSERTVSNFSGIDISGANNVFISYAPEASVSVKGYNNLVSHYKTEVEDGKLYLHYDEHTNVKNDNIQVYITMPYFDALSLSGSCSINATGSFDNTGTLSVYTSGNGDINIEDITADRYTIHSSGNSNISTLGVKAKTATVEVSGSGMVTLSVQDKLDVHISGSGKVSYKGEPAEINTDISGSGKVIKL
jgi:Putative auto-transporter adhesin, head GIN domain